METSKYEKLNQSGSGAGETRDILREPREQAQQQNFSSSALGSSRSPFTLHVFLGDNGYGAKELETAVPERLTESQRLVRALYARWDGVVTLMFHPVDTIKSAMVHEPSMPLRDKLKAVLKELPGFDKDKGPLLVCADTSLEGLALALCEQWQNSQVSLGNIDAQPSAFLYVLALPECEGRAADIAFLEGMDLPLFSNTPIPVARYDLCSSEEARAPVVEPTSPLSDTLISHSALKSLAAQHGRLYECIDRIEGAIATVHHGLEREAGYKNKRSLRFHGDKPLCLGPARIEQGTPLFIDCFEQRVREQGANAKAMWANNTSITFEALNTRANQVAQGLLAVHGEQPDRGSAAPLEEASVPVVGLCFDPSIEAVVALLGVLKAGMAFSFINKPQDKWAMPQGATGEVGEPFKATLATLKAVRPNYLLYSQSQALPAGFKEAVFDFCEAAGMTMGIHELSTVAVDSAVDNPVCERHIHQLAYVAHSSGSSGGEPKAGAMTHGGLYNILAELRDVMHIDANSVVAHESRLQFDAALTELLVPLMVGGQIVIIPPGQRLGTAEAHAAYYNPEGCANPHEGNYGRPAPTVAFWLPSVVTKMRLSPAAYPHLKTLLFTGEALDIHLAKKWYSLPAPTVPAGQRIIVNGYGPMEVTIGATLSVHHACDKDMSIGAPIRGIGLFLAEHAAPDQWLEGEPEALFPAKPTVVEGEQEGEIYLYGPGVGSYRNGQALGQAAKRFRAITVEGQGQGAPALRREQWVYQTGDRGRRDKTGHYYCLGRIDKTSEAKWHSVMVHSEEIRKHLIQHPLVSAAYVDVSHLSPSKGRCVKAYLTVLQLTTYPQWLPRGAVAASAWQHEAWAHHPVLQGYFVAHLFQSGIGAIDHWQSIKAPTHYGFMKTWPLLENSQKPDIKAIRNSPCERPFFIPDETGVELSPMEKKVIGCFEEVCLQGEPVSAKPTRITRETDFYALGGDSLEAAWLIQKLEALVAPIKLSPRYGYLTRYTTVKSIALHLTLLATMQKLKGPPSWFKPIQPEPKAIDKKLADAYKHEEPPVPAILIHPLTGDVDFYDKYIDWANKDRPIHVIEAPGLTEQAFMLEDMPSMATVYIMALRKCHPKGPYLLGGFSLGGVIAYEMACQLRAAGEEVHVFAIDAQSPTNYAHINEKETRAVLGFLNGILQRKFKLTVEMPSDAATFHRDDLIASFMKSLETQCATIAKQEDKEKATRYVDTLKHTLKAIVNYRPEQRTDITITLLACKDSEEKYRPAFGDQLGWAGKGFWMDYGCCLEGTHLDCIPKNQDTIARMYEADCQKYGSLLYRGMEWRRGQERIQKCLASGTNFTSPKDIVAHLLLAYPENAQKNPADVSHGESIAVAKKALMNFAGALALVGLFEKNPLTIDDVVAIGGQLAPHHFPLWKTEWLTSGVLALGAAPVYHQSEIKDCRYFLAAQYIEHCIAQYKAQHLCIAEDNDPRMAFFTESEKDEPLVPCCSYSVCAEDGKRANWKKDPLSLNQLNKKLVAIQTAMVKPHGMEVDGLLQLIEAVKKVSVEYRIQAHLRAFYQHTAKYLDPIAHESDKKENPWPIMHTYRRLVMQAPESDWVLYTVKAITGEQLLRLPIERGFGQNIMVFTGAGDAYLKRGHQWVCGDDGKTPLCITKIGGVSGKTIENTALAVAQWDTSTIQRYIRAALARYAEQVQETPSLSHESLFAVQETLPITEENLFKPSAMEQAKAPGQADRQLRRVLVRGPAGVGKSTLLQYLAYRWSLTAPEEGISPLWQPGKEDRAEGYAWVFWLPLKLMHQTDTVLKDMGSIGDHKAQKNCARARAMRLAYFIQRVCGFDGMGTTPCADVDVLATLLEKAASRILLLVDSFDEVAHWLKAPNASPDGEAKAAFLEALFAWKGPMLVTTRPYAQSCLPDTWSPERVVENRGFSKADAKAFITNYFSVYPPNEEEAQRTPPQASEQLWSLIQASAGAMALAQVPLMTRLLCFHWKNATPEEQKQAQAQEKHFTLTGLMQFFVESFLKRAQAKEKPDKGLQDKSNIQVLPVHKASLYVRERKKILASEKHKHPFAALSHLAFESFCAGQRQVLELSIQQRVFEDYHSNHRVQDNCSSWWDSDTDLFKAALDIGLLHPQKSTAKDEEDVLNREYTFIHLLFQEYLTAWHIHAHLDSPTIQGLISTERYNPTYQNVWRFVARLTKTEAKKQTIFWSALRQPPLSIHRTADIPMGLLCLNECMDSSQASITTTAFYTDLLADVQQQLTERLKSGPQAALKHGYLDKQWRQVWRELSPIVIAELLAPWHEAMDQALESNNTREGEQFIEALWNWLNAIGPAILPGLPPGFSKRCLDLLHSPQRHIRERGLTVAQQLNNALVGDSTFTVGLLEAVKQGSDPGVLQVVERALAVLDKEILVQEKAFVEALVQRIHRPYSGATALSALRALSSLGEHLFTVPALKEKLVYAWWSWDPAIHAHAEALLLSQGYVPSVNARIIYSMVAGLSRDNERELEVAIASIKTWSGVLGAYGFWRYGLRCALFAKAGSLRAGALGALSGLDAEEVLGNVTFRAALMEGLESGNKLVRETAWDVLASLGEAILSDKGLKAELVACLQYEAWYIRQSALSVLHGWGAKILLDKELKAGLVACLHYEDRSVRKSALGILENLGEAILSYKKLKAGLVACLQDKDWSVRKSALSVLQGWGAAILFKTLKEELMVRLQEKDPDIPDAALIVLESVSKAILSDKELKAGLVACLQNEGPHMRKEAWCVLASLGKTILSDKALGGMLVESLKEGLEVYRNIVFTWAREGKLEVWRSLGGVIGWDNKLKAGLVACLQDEDPDVREAAWDVLASLGATILGDETLRGVLVGSLKEALEMYRNAVITCVPEGKLEVWRSLGGAILSDKELKEGLMAWLQDEEPDARKKALSVLKSLGEEVLLSDKEVNKKVKAGLVACLQDEEPDVRKGAVFVLASLGEAILSDKELKEGLMACFKDEDWGMCWGAGRALASFGKAISRDKELKECLMVCFQDKDPDVRKEAVFVLASLGEAILPDKELKERLMAYLKAKTGWVRREAVSVLASLGKAILSDKELKEGLMACFKDENVAVCLEALFVLKRLGQEILSDEGLKEGLVTCLKDKAGWVRREAVSVLTHLREAILSDKELKECLMVCFQDEAPDVRGEAVSVLASVGEAILLDKELKEGLMACFKDENVAVRLEALFVLKRLGEKILPNEKLKAELTEWITDDDENVCRIALGSRNGLGIGQLLGDTALKGGFVACFEKVNEEVRREALGILEGSERWLLSAAALKRTLVEDLQNEVKCVHGVALGRFKEVIPSDVLLVRGLMVGLKDRNGNVRVAAWSALNSLGKAVFWDDALKTTLAAGLKDKGPIVYESAWGTFKNLGKAVFSDDMLKQAFMECLQDEEIYLAIPFKNCWRTHKKAWKVFRGLGKSVLKDETLKQVFMACLYGSCGAGEEAWKAFRGLGEEALKDETLRQVLLGYLHGPWGAREEAWKAFRDLGGGVLQDAALKNAALKEELVACLQDTNRHVRRAALGAMQVLGEGALKYKAVRKAFVVCLQDTNRHVRIVALGAMQLLGKETLAYGELKEAFFLGLQDEDLWVRKAAWHAFKFLGKEVLWGDRLKKAFVACLRDTNKHVRRVALGAMEVLGQEALAYEELKKAFFLCLQDEDPWMRAAAWYAFKFLGKEAMKDEKLKEAFVACLQDRNGGVRIETLGAMEVLGQEILAYEELRKAFFLCLQDEDPYVRKAAWYAFKFLGKEAMKDEKLKEAFVACLQDRDEDVRIAALGALENLNEVALWDEALKVAFVACLQDGGGWMRSVAWDIFKVLAKEVLWGDALGAVFVACLQDRNGVTRKAALGAMPDLGQGTLEYKGLKEAFVACLQDTDNDVRKAALDALKNLKEVALWDEALKVAFVACLQDKNHVRVFEAAWNAFKDLGKAVLLNKMLRPVFIECFEHEYKQVRKAALGAMPNLCKETLWDDTLTAAFVACLKDEDEEISQAARDTLRNLDKPTLCDDRFKELLFRHLRSSNEDVIIYGMQALALLGPAALSDPDDRIVMPVLEGLLKDWQGTPPVLCEVLKAIGAIGVAFKEHTLVYEMVQTSLFSPVPDVRCAALGVLGQWGPAILKGRENLRGNLSTKEKALNHAQVIIANKADPLELSLTDTIAPCWREALLKDQDEGLSKKIYEALKKLPYDMAQKIFLCWLAPLMEANTAFSETQYGPLFCLIHDYYFYKQTEKLCRWALPLFLAALHGRLAKANFRPLVACTDLLKALLQPWGLKALLAVYNAPSSPAALKPPVMEASVIESLLVWVWNCIDYSVTIDATGEVQVFSGLYQATEVKGDNHLIKLNAPRAVSLLALLQEGQNEGCVVPDSYEKEEQAAPLVAAGATTLPQERQGGSVFWAGAPGRGVNYLYIMAWGKKGERQWSLLLEKRGVSQGGWECYYEGVEVSPSRGLFEGGKILTCSETGASRAQSRQKVWCDYLQLSVGEEYYCYSPIQLSKEQCASFQAQVGALVPVAGVGGNSFFSTQTKDEAVYQSLKELLTKIGILHEDTWPNICNDFFDAEAGYYCKRQSVPKKQEEAMNRESSNACLLM